MRILALVRAVLAATGILLLGGALVLAPVVAFHGGDMTWITKAGLAGVAIALVAKLIPAPRLPVQESGPGGPPAEGR